MVVLDKDWRLWFARALSTRYEGRSAKIQSRSRHVARSALLLTPFSSAESSSVRSTSAPQADEQHEAIRAGGIGPDMPLPVIVPCCPSLSRDLSGGPVT